MPLCPKCCKKLTKRKNPKEYYCTRHGFSRAINSPPEGMSYEEFKQQLKGTE